IGVAILVVLLLALEVLRKNFPERKYWSIFNCLLLAILLGVCIGEICNATVLKVLLLDTIVIALITVGVSIYQNIMERKDDLEYQNEEKPEVIEEDTASSEEKPAVVRQIPGHNEAPEEEQPEQPEPQQDFEMPSPEVVANLVRNLSTGSEESVL
ncbi:MAG: hypothetical protein ACI4VQ_03720, partial [Clostridia bacterium]